MKKKTGISGKKELIRLFKSKNNTVIIFFLLVFFLIGKQGFSQNSRNELTANAGDEEKVSRLKVSIYPNPVQTTATISINSNVSVQDKLSIEIYDILGKQVKQISNLKDNTILIDRSDLPQGMYIYRLRQNEKVIETGKIYIQ